MRWKPSLRDGFWFAQGVLGLVVLALLLTHYYRQVDPAAELASKNARVDLVERMRLDLASASEAEKSAVMAVTDSESQAFADQARARSGAVEREIAEMERLLAAGGAKQEKDLLPPISRAFADCRRIDRDLLDLAVKNTNLKAYALAFGPAAKAAGETDGALSDLIARTETSRSPQAARAIALAAGAQSAVLRIRALLPAHIYEENDARMDAMEASMASDDRQVRQDLEALGPLVSGADADGVRRAAASYARFSDLRAQIVRLSRQNTNVRSAEISLNEKRLALLKCQDAMAALEAAIRAEPVSERTQPRPR